MLGSALEASQHTFRLHSLDIARSHNILAQPSLDARGVGGRELEKNEITELSNGVFDALTDLQVLARCTTTHYLLEVTLGFCQYSS